MTMPPAPAPQQAAPPSGLRKSNTQADDSPVSVSSTFAGRQGSSVLSSHEDSITSSMFGDSESVTTDEIPFVVSRKATGEWEEGGLGISDADTMVPGPEGSPKVIPQLTVQRSAPPQLERGGSRPVEKLRSRREGAERRGSESTESADDEDEELGLGRERQPRRSTGPLGKPPLPSSKLGVEMMRANSHDSAVGSESTPEAVTQVVTTPAQEAEEGSMLGSTEAAAARTPPEGGDATAGTKEGGRASVDATPRPAQGSSNRLREEEDATPRPAGK